MISTALLRHHGLNRPSCPRASSKYVKLKPESSRESTTACATLTLKGDLAKDVSYEGDVIIYGDVHPGVCIQAAGDVTVWGRLVTLSFSSCSISVLLSIEKVSKLLDQTTDSKTSDESMATIPASEWH